ncbi:MAG: 30S ribosomal protein S8 [Acidobacteriota bacterium]
MSMTDPISDLLTRIRNAIIAKHDRLDVPASRIKEAVCRLLAKQGYLLDVERIDGTPQDSLRVYLRYAPDGTPAITHISRVSKPGRRVYRGSDAIKPILNGLGVAIVSTSRGLMTDHDARAQGVGGEILCQIW